MRYQLHIPLQLAALAIAALHHPSMCAACFANVVQWHCQRAALVTATLMGYLLPTVALRQVESRSRSVFVQQLQALAAQM